MFAFFGFAAKIALWFLCIISLVSVINSKRHEQDPNDRTLGQRLPEEGESHLTFSLTNEGKFLSPRTCWCHQTASSLQYLYFITEGRNSLSLRPLGTLEAAQADPNLQNELY